MIFLIGLDGLPLPPTPAPGVSAGQLESPANCLT